MQAPDVNESDAKTIPAHTPTRRRRVITGRRVMGAALGLAVLLGLGYALLPWLVPTRWLADRIAVEIARTMNRAVQIDRLRLSWLEGVVIEGLTIRRRPGFGDGPFVRVRRVQCAFKPISALRDKPIEQLNLLSPEVWVVIVNEDGVQRLNISDLGAEGMESVPPGECSALETVLHLEKLDHSSKPLRTSDEQATAQPDPNTIALRLGQLAVRLDERTGQARWKIRGRLPEFGASSGTASTQASLETGTLATEGSVTMPKLNADVKLSGGGRIRWDRLDLTSIPVRLIPGSTVDRVSGWSAGMLDVRVQEDLSVDISFESELSDLSVHRREGPEGKQIDKAKLSASGRWNPTADVLVLNSFACGAPGLELAAKPRPDGEPIRFALHDERLIDIHLIGRVNDLARIRQWSPELDKLLSAQTRTDGGFDFDVSWRHMVSGDRLRLAADSTRMRVHRPDTIDIEHGMAAALRLDLLTDRPTNALDLRELEFRLAGLDLEASLRAPLDLALGALEPQPATQQARKPADGPWGAAIHGLRGSISARCQDAAELTQRLPSLAAPLREVSLAGPMSASVDLQPSEGATEATHLQAFLDVPANSTLAVGEQFVKPGGAELAARAEVQLPRNAHGELDRVGVDVRCGKGRLRVRPDRSRVRLAVQRHRDRAVPTTAAATSRPAPSFLAHAYLSADVEIAHVEDLLAALPALLREIRTKPEHQPLAGDAKLTLEANVTNIATGDDMVPDVWRVHADAVADDLAIDLAPDLVKPAGRRAHLAVDHLYDRSLNDRPHRHASRLALVGATANARYEWGGDQEVAELDVDAADAGAVLAHVPSLARDLARYKISGGMRVSLTSRRGPDRHVVGLRADATRLGWVIEGDDPFIKSAGVPCKVSTRIVSKPEDTDPAPHEMAIEEFEAMLAASRLRARQGRLVVRPGTHGKLSADYMTKHPRWWWEASPFREVALSTQGTLVFDATLRSLSPAIDRIAQRYDLIGSAESEVAVSIDPNSVRLSGQIRADRLNVNASPHLVKPPGTAALVTFDIATLSGAEPADGRTTFVVHEGGLRFGDIRVRGKGDVWLQHDQDLGLPTLGGFALSADYDVPQLARVQTLVPSLYDEPLSGGVRGTVSVSAEGARYRLGASTLIADNVRTKVADEPVSVDGVVSASSDRIDSEGLDIQLGDNRLTVAGHVLNLAEHPRGSVFLIARELDLDDMREWPARLQGLGQANQTQPVGPEFPVATSKPVMPADEEDEQRLIAAQPVFDFLKRCDLTGRAHIGSASVTGEKTNATYRIDELVSDFRLAAGRVVVPFRCAFSGGVVDGEFTMTADRANPYFDLKYKAVDIRAEDNVKKLVLYDFPGLHADGKVTLIDATRQRFFNEPGVLNHPVGEGDWIIDGGAYVGRAAPIWLTRIFPGLNTARYKFRRMHDWFKKHVDGRVDHHMIYQGEVYNIYMKGHSMATTGRSHYEVGIDLLAGMESKYWSETGQGRVALFTADARVVDGVEVEKIIRFVPLHRVIYDVFLRSNVVTAAYYALKQQAMQKAPDQPAEKE